MDFSNNLYKMLPFSGDNSLPEIVFFILLLAAGFFLLIKGADFFVDGASKVAVKMKIPQIVIGLTIVAFGTSAPEAAVSINSALKGTAGIAVGNVLGSNIFNILLILGITSMLASLPIKRNTLVYEIPFVIFISVLLPILGLDGNVGLFDGLILSALFIGFFIYLIWISKNGTSASADDVKPLTDKDKLPRLITLIILGLAAIVLGSDFAVFGASKIASVAGISERVIGLTIVACGTSLPELVTSILAARKGQRDIALGNIIGSNIFNILLVLGVSALVSPDGIMFSERFNFDAAVSIAAAALLLLLVIKNKSLSRIGGTLMTMAYVSYTAYIVISN